MGGCDAWSTFKILELILSIVCVIYKRVNDDEASRLFYYLTKLSREWPLLNNITWDHNGSIFTDVTYGGYVFISAGLLLAYCTGELDYCKRTETFFLIFGALSYIVVGAVLLAAIEWVPNELVDNAAILGTLSLITAAVFIIDLLSASTRRKKRAKLLPKIVKGNSFDKANQTDGEQHSGMRDIYSNGDANGYMQNGLGDTKKIPRNSVKLLPTSPGDEFQASYPVTNSNREFVGTIPAPFTQVYTATDLKNPANKIKSTESFLKNEKGEFPIIKRREYDRDRTPTPPGYAQIKHEKQNMGEVVVPTGYVMLPIQELSVNQLKKLETNPEQPRKLQSPTVSTTVRTPQGYYMSSDSRIGTPIDRKIARAQTPNYPSSGSEESIPISYPNSSKSFQKRDSPSSNEEIPPMFKLEYPQKKYTKKDSEYGKLNRGYAEDEVDFKQSPFQRNSYLRSSNYTEKPKGILRMEEKEVKKDQEDFNSLDSRRIADDLKHLKEVTNSSLDVSQLEKENRLLKENLKKEKEEKYQLKTDLKLEIVEQKLAELDDRKQLEKRIQELEQLKNDLKLAKGFRDSEEEQRIELRIKEMEDEKDRRMSEREEHYFGIIDLKKSQKDVSPETKPKLADLEDYFKKGAKDVNAKLKEKTREEEEIKKVIDEGFLFLEDEKRKGQKFEKIKASEKLSSPDLTSMYVKSAKGSVKYESSDEDKSRPESASYKSEAQFWLEEPEGKERAETPSTPRDPGYVLHAAKFWEGKTSPIDRFGFSSQKAQHLRLEGLKPEKVVLKFDDETKIPPKMVQYVEFDEKSKEQTQLLDHEDEGRRGDKVQGRRSGMLVRKVDFPDHVMVREINPTTVGSTSTWKKWLQPRPKLASSRSNP